MELPVGWSASAAIVVGVIAMIYSSRWVKLSLSLEHEVSRKLVHVAGSALAAALPYWVADRRSIATATLVLAALIPLLSGRGWFPAMVNRERSAAGPVYVLAVYTVLLVSPVDRSLIAASMLVVGLGDALACLVGRRWGRRRIHPDTGRTWLGTGAMFASSLLVIALYGIAVGWPLSVLVAASLSIAGMASCVEALSARSLDNLLVPALTAVALFLVGDWSAGRGATHVVELAGAVGVVALGWSRRWVDPTGALAVFAIAVLVFVGAGTPTVALLVLFFASSSVLTRFRAERAVQRDAAHGRSSRQALALGAVPALCALAYGLSADPAWLGAAAAAVAAGAADTFATEIGRHSRRDPISIVGFERVDPGVSGGVTPLGTAGALVGATVLAFAGHGLGLATSVFTLAAIGFLASVLDSVMGATVQARFQCGACGAIVEDPRERHRAELVRHSGLAWVTNERVNAAMSAFAAGAFLAVTLG